MSKDWLPRICLATAVLLTVYNFFITDTPDHKATGIIFLLVMVPSIVATTKK